jgi:LuxR family transcriptional regulator, quorum-sensing system regulator SolR
MLRALVPQPPTFAVAKFAPPIVRPLVDAGSCQKSLTLALQGIARGLGFDAFMYGVTTSTHPKQESRTYVWTDLPEDWVRLYDQRAYIEIDPRLRAARESMLPVIWHRRAFPDSEENRQFFDAAAIFGIRSGVAIALRNSFHAPALFFLNSSADEVDDPRRRQITEALGQLLVVATYVHELFLANVIERCLPPPTEGRPLSARERECLQLAARGLTSLKIGASLGIGERTVHQHFSNLLGKLGATNRHEAIAKATAAGLIER